jgi:hypothetical protein
MLYSIQLYEPRKTILFHLLLCRILSLVICCKLVVFAPRSCQILSLNSVCKYSTNKLEFTWYIIQQYIHSFVVIFFFAELLREGRLSKLRPMATNRGKTSGDGLGCRWDKDVGLGVVSSGRKYSARFSTKNETKSLERHFLTYRRIGVAFFK